MDTSQHQTSMDNKKREEEEEEETDSLEAESKQKSPGSSPVHEFSFTISLHSSSSFSSSTTTTTTTNTSDDNNNNNNNKTKTTPSSFAIDLSPADEIFFHGHLLPLHLLSHLPAAVSPRSSTNSMDSFTLPIKDLTNDKKFDNSKFSNSITSSNNSEEGNIKAAGDYHHQQMNSSLDDQTKGRRANKSKSFSLFGFAKWRKDYEVRDQEGSDINKDQKQKKKLRFDVVSHVIKKYVRMVRPLLIYRRRRENGHHLFQRQPCSFSGNLSFRDEQEEVMMTRGGGGRRRGEISAPASIRTSPTNSGLLVSKANVSSSSSDSTMEELHAAIQAAIAHCKNSIAVEEKLKC